MQSKFYRPLLTCDLPWLPYLFGAALGPSPSKSYISIYICIYIYQCFSLTCRSLSTLPIDRTHTSLDLRESFELLWRRWLLVTYYTCVIISSRILPLTHSFDVYILLCCVLFIYKAMILIL